MKRMLQFIQLLSIVIFLIAFATACDKSDDYDAIKPSSLTMFSGYNQTGLLSQPLSESVIVIVKNQKGNPCKNVKVNFVANNGGSLSANEVLTDISGLASVTWTLGDNDSVQTAIATVFEDDGTTLVTGSPLTFTAKLSFRTILLCKRWRLISGILNDGRIIDFTNKEMHISDYKKNGTLLLQDLYYYGLDRTRGISWKWIKNEESILIFDTEGWEVEQKILKLKEDELWSQREDVIYKCTP